MVIKSDPKAQADRERDAIRIFMKNLGHRYPDPDFESDACTFSLGDAGFLFSTDEFSAEDNFRSHHPATLGWNMAAATMSDILAAGGIPLFYGHSVTIQYDWDSRFIGDFSNGIGRCLEAAGASFLGGDLGMADKWKYTGIAIGKKMADLSRRGAKEGDIIYMTGNVGAGNLEAALLLYSDIKLLKPLLDRVNVSFPLRMREAGLVRKYANCCIDSSDGLFRALQDLSRISRTGFRIDHVPYNPHGKTACRLLGKPEEILFLGECGEYELVFTISPDTAAAFLSEMHAQNLAFTKLGVITADDKKLLMDGAKSLDLTRYSLYARNFNDVSHYISEVIQFIKDGSD